MARPDLFFNRKFKRLSAALQMPAVYVRAHLESMWEVGYQSGNPYLGDTASDVESCADWGASGRPVGQWFEAVLGSFVDERDGCFYIHDLLDNAPEYVRKRAKRHASRKNKDLREETADNGGQRRTFDENGCPPSPSPSPSPSPLRKDSSPPQAADEQAASAAVFPDFPIVGRNGGSWKLPDALLSELRAAYPGVDALAECRRAHAWCIANPRNRKTATGMARFINSWLSRAQNSSRPTGGNGSAVVDHAGERVANAEKRRNDQLARVNAMLQEEQ